MIELYTAATPNGFKVSVALEELGLDYRVRSVSFARNEQKSPWFLKINPNGRIPAIIDHQANDFTVFESGAILLYLAEKTGRLIPPDARGRSEVTQWLMFQMGGVGPMMGQANVFFRYAPERIPYAIERYQREVRRLFEVLDRRLADREYLVDEYSIADIANWCWVRTYDWSGVDLNGLDALAAWVARIGAREAAQRGILIPKREASGEAEFTEAGRKLLV